VYDETVDPDYRLDKNTVTHIPIWAATVLVIGAAVASPGCVTTEAPVLTFSGSVVGREADVIRGQLERFGRAHPSIKVALRATPDAADQRHQLYVQWLNARASDPDVLQLDVVWTPEFAAAGWIAGLDRFDPPVDRFFTAAVAADRWNGALYALPWFIDVGTLYWRTDLVPRPPRDLADLVQLARAARDERGVPFGFVWQGARYEGLVTVFLEHLGAFGGAILDDQGRVVVDSEAAERALSYMRDAIYVDGVVPPAVLTWQEEQTRFAFQTGQAVFMRNWPYAYGLLQDGSQSSVAGRFAVTSMPAGPGGAPTAALGGAALAINAYSDQPAEAYALIEYLLQPEQMIERARVAGQYPTRPALYGTPALAEALTIPPADALTIIERAVPRPVTPVYSQLSEMLQISLHRALTRQQEPRAALRDAAAAMRALLAKVKLGAPVP
jgi:multiple sugar transport system substrate-binding protein